MKGGQAVNRPAQRSQLVHEDPAKYLESVKRRVQDKEGVPVEHQRLLFAVPASSDSSAQDSPPCKAVAEDLLPELRDWQAILFQNGKAIGRLVSPRLSTTAVSQPPSLRPLCEFGLPVELVSVKFDRWQPCGQTRQPVHSAPSLNLACTGDLLSSTCSLRIFGCTGGSSFASLHQYEFTGQQVQSALSYHRQRSDYIRKQQLKHSLWTATASQGSHAPPPGKEASEVGVEEDLVLELGVDWQRFALVLDPLTLPAAIKSVILRLVLVACSFLDEAQVKQLHQTQTGQPSGLRNSMSTGGNAPSAGARGARRRDARQDQSEAQQQRRTSRAPLPSSAASEWLPYNVDSPQSGSSTEQTARQGRKGASSLQASKLEPSMGQHEHHPASPALSAASSLPVAGDEESPASSPAHPDALQRPSSQRAQPLMTAFRRQQSNRGPVPAALGSNSAEAPAGSWDMLLLEADAQAGAANAGQHQQSPSASRQGSGTLLAGTSGVPSSLCVLAPRPQQQPSASRPSSPSGLPPGLHGRRQLHAVAGGAHVAESSSSDGTPTHARRRRLAAERSAAGLSSVAALPPHAGAPSAPSPASEHGIGQQQGSGRTLEAQRSSQTLSRLGRAPVSAGQPAAVLPAAQATAGGSPHLQTGSGLRAGQDQGPRRTEANHAGAGIAGVPAALFPPELPSDKQPMQQPHPQLLAASGAVSSMPGRQQPSSQHAERDEPSSTQAALPSSMATRGLVMQLGSDGLPALLVDGRLQAPSARLPQGLLGAVPRSVINSVQPRYLPSAVLQPSSVALSTSRLPAQAQATPSSNGTAGLLGRPGSASASLPGGLARPAASPSAPPPSASEPLTQPGALLPQLPSSASQASGVDNQLANGMHIRESTSMQSLEGLMDSHNFWRAGQQDQEQQEPSSSALTTGYLPPLVGQSDVRPTGSRPQLSAQWSSQGNGQLQQPSTPYPRPGAMQRSRSDGLLHAAGSHELDAVGAPGPASSAAGPQQRSKVAVAAQGTKPAPLSNGAGGLSRPSAALTDLQRDRSCELPGPQGFTRGFGQNAHECTDLERFLLAVTPVLREPSLGGWRLEDAWQIFGEVSAFGQSIYTRGSFRGPAIAYYQGFLSGVQLLMSSKPAEAPKDCKVYRHDGELLHVFWEYLAPDVPFKRPPIADDIRRLTSDRPALRQTTLASFHPLSWFAVAWYPIYRIPDARLDAQFLTFHSLKPTPIAATHFGAMHGLPDIAADATGADAAAGPLVLPIVGLKWANMHSEYWWELPPPIRDTKRGAPGTEEGPAVGQGTMPKDLRDLMVHLQESARALGSGQYLQQYNATGALENAKLSYGDFDYFCRRQNGF